MLLPPNVRNFSGCLYKWCSFAYIRGLKFLHNTKKKRTYSFPLQLPHMRKWRKIFESRCHEVNSRERRSDCTHTRTCSDLMSYPPPTPPHFRGRHLSVHKFRHRTYRSYDIHGIKGLSLLCECGDICGRSGGDCPDSPQNLCLISHSTLRRSAWTRPA